MTGPALANAIEWARAMLTGTAATAVTVIAVAIVGLLMLTGRMPVRRGAITVLGCFILFGAGFIADGLLNSIPSSELLEETSAPRPTAYAPTVPKPQPYDPYAGAAVPLQQAPESLVPR